MRVLPHSRSAVLALALVLPALSMPVVAAPCPDSGLTPVNYRAYVRRIQEELPRHGYRPSAPDGVLGPRTIAGIKHYQRDAMLPADGCVTPALLDHMLYHLPKVYAGSAADTALERDVQQALALRGYYRGRIDGIVGPKTLAALEAFQRDAGLRVNRVVNRSVLASIRDADPALRAP